MFKASKNFGGHVILIIECVYYGGASSLMRHHKIRFDHQIAFSA